MRNSLAWDFPASKMCSWLLHFAATVRYLPPGLQARALQDETTRRAPEPPLKFHLWQVQLVVSQIRRSPFVCVEQRCVPLGDHETRTTPPRPLLRGTAVSRATSQTTIALSEIDPVARNLGERKRERNKGTKGKTKDRSQDPYCPVGSQESVVTGVCPGNLRTFMRGTADSDEATPFMRLASGCSEAKVSTDHKQSPSRVPAARVFPAIGLHSRAYTSCWRG